MPRCNQIGCLQPAAYRYTWPGKSEETICAGHAVKVKDTANCLGINVSMIMLGPQDFGMRGLGETKKPEIET